MEFDPATESKFDKLARNAKEPLPLAAFAGTEEAEMFVNWCLNGSYDDDGIQAWWEQPRHLLDGRSPSEAWPQQPERVIGLAGWLVNMNLDFRPDKF